MSRGLNRRPFQVFNGGGLDTKTDKRLVPAGELVEIENMYMLKTGELRMRNGFASLGATYGGIAGGLGGPTSMFATAQGGLGQIQGGVDRFGEFAWKYSSGSWIKAQPVGMQGQHPTTRALVTPIAGMYSSTTGGAQSAPSDMTDPDCCVAGGSMLTTWIDATNAPLGFSYYFKDLATGKFLYSSDDTATGATDGRPPVCQATPSGFACAFFHDGAGGMGVFVFVDGSTSSPTLYSPIAGLDVAAPWIDAKPIPGGNLIAIAFKAAAGGVTCFIFNPATGARTATVNTAAADASMCLGWMDNAYGTVGMMLATAGAGAGVVYRTMNFVTLVVSFTTVIDNTATANVRNITGAFLNGTSFAEVIWTVAGAPTYLDKIMIGRDNGPAVTVTMAPSFGLVSRSYIDCGAPVGGWGAGYSVLGSYDSAVQPSYSVLPTHPFTPNETTGGPADMSKAQIMPGNAGGRRRAVSSLANVVTLNSGTGFANLLTVMPRALRVLTPSGTSTKGRAVQQVRLSVGAQPVFRPRELGGTLFMPGGVVSRDDGRFVSIATCPFYPEAPSGVSSATGAMTASGAYSYRTVYARQDASGRITRSAGSVPFAITLGAGDGRVLLTIPTQGLFIHQSETYTVEIYRAGPAAAGATAYNKVGEAYATGGGTSLNFLDTMSDANAALGELAYFTGSVLENFVTPSCTLLEVCGNRVGIVNAEQPTQFWPSLEYKAGQGIRFNPLLAIDVTGDGYGAITALGAMDGRWILFKSNAIYVISGAGPNDVGQGSFSPPQACSLSIGTVLPGSVVATPDGLMFQGAAGIYLLDRGLGLTYIGAPVEQYTLAENIVDAALVNGVTQVRFVMASGRCLVWDYHHKRWYSSKLRVDASTIVACANTTLHGWCYALANGAVMQETPGVYQDVNGTTTAIVPRIGFPALALAGINGFERFYGVDILGEIVGNHTLAVDFEYDYGGAVTETRTFVVTGAAGSGLQVEVLPATQKVTSVKITLRTSALAAGSGAFRLSGITLWGGMKKGTNIPFTKRAT